eukprot:396219-Pyramimonas_sp.AAC.1
MIVLGTLPVRVVCSVSRRVRGPPAAESVARGLPRMVSRALSGKASRALSGVVSRVRPRAFRAWSPACSP